MLTPAFARVALILLSACLVTTAAAETRTLKLQHVHSREKADIVYKKDGRYVPAGLQAANRILRDWRTQDVIAIDPRLLDVVWEVYRQTGATSYVQVIGGHRSNRTNEMLRSRSTGVAKGSLHTHGKAIDLFIPGVPLRSVRDAGLRLQAGGVGFYPSSGSPFVHLDVGGVRHWPRLAPAEYASIIKNSAPMAGASTQVASLDEEAGDRAEMSFLQRLFGRPTRAAPEAPVAVAAATPTRNAPAPVAAARPAAMESDFDTSSSRPSRVAAQPVPEPTHQLPRRGPLPTFAVRSAPVDEPIAVAEVRAPMPEDESTVGTPAAPGLTVAAVAAYGQSREPVPSSSRFEELFNRHPLRDAERTTTTVPAPVARLPLWTGALEGLGSDWVTIDTAASRPDDLLAEPDLIIRSGFDDSMPEFDRRFSGQAIEFQPILRTKTFAVTTSGKSDRLPNRFAVSASESAPAEPFARARLADGTAPAASRF